MTVDVPRNPWARGTPGGGRSLSTSRIPQMLAEALFAAATRTDRAQTRWGPGSDSAQRGWWSAPGVPLRLRPEW